MHSARWGGSLPWVPRDLALLRNPQAEGWAATTKPRRLKPVLPNPRYNQNLHSLCALPARGETIETRKDQRFAGRLPEGYLGDAGGRPDAHQRAARGRIERDSASSDRSAEAHDARRARAGGPRGT